MSFFNKFKRALGFNSEGDDIDELDYYEMSGRTPYVNPFKKPDAEPQQQQQPRQHEHDTEPEHQIDVEVQPEGIPQELMAPFSAYINRIRQEAAQQVRDEQERMKALVEKAEGKSQATDENLAQAKEKLAVSEAQRRAAQTRANDLAARVAALEAEEEQLILEKKSLLNKLKVMQVRNDMDEASMDDVERMAKLADEVQEKSALIEERDRQILQLTEQVQQLTQQTSRLQDQLDEANTNLEIVEKLQEQLQEVALFKEKKNNEVLALKERIAEFEQQGVLADEQLKAQLKLAQEQELKLKKQIEEMNRKAKVNAERQNRRDIDLANHIDDLKQQLATVSKTASSRQAEALQQHQDDTRRIDELQQQLQRALNEAKVALTQRDQLQLLLDQARELQVKAQNNEKTATDRAQRARDDARAAREEVKKLQRDIRHLKKELQQTTLQPAPADKQDGDSADLYFPVDTLPDAFAEVPYDEQPMEQPSAEPESPVGEANVEKTADEPVSGDSLENPSQEIVLEQSGQDSVMEDALMQPSPQSDEIIPSLAPIFIPDEPVVAEEKVSEPESASGDDDMFGGIDDIDWLVPAEPNQPEPDPEPIEQPVSALHESDGNLAVSSSEARQLSLF